MKKQPKRLSLSRETINLLDSDHLAKVNGGVFIPSRLVAGGTCSIDVCPSDSCVHTTCY
ncbi:MAG TPA: class I lanthipeptide [Thermoanaerobaculia bacterium]|jgi:hypothetical protein|nr:class I lanthipeptide [Thermoanaerobaculia bacterium]